jgi:hypothetical protein
MHEYDILCVIAAWNYKDSSKYKYPESWKNIESNISMPWDSINWITVWSIWEPKLWDNYVSNYSRKDNIEYPTTYKERTKKYRKKPDLLTFGGYDSNEFTTIGIWWKIIKMYGTSFATPYITHLLSIIKSFYPNLTMNSLKALLLNKTIWKDFDKVLNFNKTIFENVWVDYKRLYWNGIIPKSDIDNSSFALSSNDSVTIIIESEFDFSNYEHQNYPFITTKIKIPELMIKRWEHVIVKATLCYNPFVNSTGILSDYNTCFLWFLLHYWSDKFTDKWWNKTELTKLKWPFKWSWEPSEGQFWNNLWKLDFILTKKEYNKLVKEDLAITIKWMLKKDKDNFIIDYYKINKQKFSLVITIEDEWKEWKIYDYIKLENSLNTVIENDAKLQWLATL